MKKEENEKFLENLKKELDSGEINIDDYNGIKEYYKEILKEDEE